MSVWLGPLASSWPSGAAGAAWAVFHRSSLDLFTNCILGHFSSSVLALNNPQQLSPLPRPPRPLMAPLVFMSAFPVFPFCSANLSKKSGRGGGGGLSVFFFSINTLKIIIKWGNASSLLLSRLTPTGALPWRLNVPLWACGCEELSRASARRHYFLLTSHPFSLPLSSPPPPLPPGC